MEHARLDCYSFQDQLSMFHLLLCKCFDKLLKQDDKGDVSNRDNGSCPGRIGSADCLGPWFDALLVQWCLEKYADHIALPVVFSLPAELGVSAEPVLGSLLPGTSSRQKCPPRTSFGQPITRHFKGY
ncbi:hypothetical protein V6N12_028841 [Hibiscus sabdariffa]|uniref:Uncharacterized protein n=1 Tax=Hibiscus sabdariffa TaxID=183260 RepID=A0ABR2F6Z7_9ROSI